MDGSNEAPLLSVVIPTRDRRELLLEGLSRLGDQAAGAPIEVIVAVDAGSSDGTADAAQSLAEGYPAPLRVLGPSAADGEGGPAATRNRGIEQARAAVCLLLDDDVWPAEGVLSRHLAFHEGHPGDIEALLGRVVPAPGVDSALARWAHDRGAIFDYSALRRNRPVPPKSFWTAQVSVKRSLLLRSGGFDTAFPSPYFEDVELAMRLDRAGMLLSYDPEALAEHQQEVTLPGLIDRARRSGPQFRVLAEKAPEIQLPRRPGLRHRVRAAGLTAAELLGLGPATREAMWRFLIDEAQREALWEGNVEGALRIGEGLRRRAGTNDRM